MVTLIYFITFVATVMMMGLYILRNPRVDSSYVLFCIAMTLNSLGRWLIASSSTLEQVLWAHKMLYLGACFIPLLFFVILSRFCDIRLPVIMKAVLAAFSCVVYGLVLTVGHSPIYYKSLWLARGDGYTYLIKEYGPAHILYPVMLLLYLLLILGLIVFAIKKRKKIAYGTALTIGVVGFIIIFIYFATRAADSSFEWISLGYMVGIFGVTRIFDKINMYDMSTNIAVSVANANENGFIVFDTKKRFINCNSLIKNIFPEVLDWQVERIPPTDGSFLCREIISWFLENESMDERKTININDNYYEITVRDITLGKKKRLTGYLLQATDRTAEHNYTASVEKYKNELESEVEYQIGIIKAQSEKNEQLLSQTVFALSNAVDAKDNYTSGHSRRVAEYSKLIAARMGKTAAEQDEIYRAGLLHDVGKIRVPESIINKPGKLTEDEYTVMKLHPITGYHILKGIASERIFADGARFHHERYDGKGYPVGLTGKQIPEIARIIGTADAYDAMASRRSYRNTMTQKAIRNEIEKGKGTQFDPEIADIMLRLIDEDKDYKLRESAPVQKRILVADEAPENIQTVVDALKDKEHYFIVGGSNLEDTVRLLNVGSYDLAIIDIKILETAGIERLASLRDRNDLPVVITTSDIHSIDNAEMNRYSVSNIIAKPFAPEVLREIIHATISE